MSNNYNTRTQPSYTTPSKDEIGKTSSLNTPIHSHVGVTPLRTTPPNTIVSATPTSSSAIRGTSAALRDPQEPLYYSSHDHNNMHSSYAQQPQQTFYAYSPSTNLNVNSLPYSNTTSNFSNPATPSNSAVLPSSNMIFPQSTSSFSLPSVNYNSTSNNPSNVASMSNSRARVQGTTTPTSNFQQQSALYSNPHPSTLSSTAGTATMGYNTHRSPGTLASNIVTDSQLAYIRQPQYIQQIPEGSGSYIDPQLMPIRGEQQPVQLLTSSKAQRAGVQYSYEQYLPTTNTGSSNQLLHPSSSQHYQPRPTSSLSNQIPTSSGSPQGGNVMQTNYNTYGTTTSSYYQQQYGNMTSYPTTHNTPKTVTLSRTNSTQLVPGSSMTCPIVVTDDHGQTLQRQNPMSQNYIQNMNSRSYSPAIYNGGHQQQQHYTSYAQPQANQYIVTTSTPPQMPPPQNHIATVSQAQPSTSNSNYPVGLLVGSKYRLMNKIGNGAFGEVFLAQNTDQSQDFYAVKLETIPTPQNGQNNGGKQQLIFEAKVLSYLFNAPPNSTSSSNGSTNNNTQQNQPAVGIPRVIWYGTESSFNIMVMELLGQSLESLFKKCNRKFSLKTVLMLADQMIQRIEFTHRRNFVHRDIKPDNFLMGRKGSNMLQLLNGTSYQPTSTNGNLNTENTVYLIDFGLSKMYYSEKGHIPLRKDKHLTGTARYASLNNHKGYEQSRRDDLESLGYVLLYFLKGALPWQGLTGNTKEDHYNNIYHKKKNIKVVSLCKGFPVEFATYLNYARGLKFYQEPDYLYLRNLFLNLFIREKFSLDYEWDWIVQDRKSERQK
ncbi:hypothetical protein C9374_012999 [Naegleria lovaniensis]|uniref:non-specific serine/threonine protein kinase n=1 Tax=Naegleria lovaniensis TaxID=51637 RepID=A0AA88GBZ3_NAELO|nr:uncharacterized protein C9374_012999 [Naegleria lovaniensis]KAG2372969.1 hypothetical protein C9374_012999 [Naegleria lovaniensis]